jgi:hypothetical protein
VNKLAVLVLLVGLAACSRKKPEEGREPAQTAAPGAVVGSAAPGPAAPAGAASGSAATGGTAPEAARAAPDVGCATTTTLACGADQVDGCASGLTAVHVCVAKDAKAGPPCAQPQAPSCPSGQVDACLHDPPQATTHLCVVVAKSAP